MKQDLLLTTDSVFVVQHLHTIDEDREDVKLIGVYQSRAIAVSAIERLREQPGFRDSPEIIDPMSCIHPDGFYIDEYQVDQDHWTQGFITVS